MGWPRLESEFDARPENEDGSSLERGCASPPSSDSNSASSSTSTTTSPPSSSSPSPSAPSSGMPGDGGNGICSCSLLSRGPKPGKGYGMSLIGMALPPSIVVSRTRTSGRGCTTSCPCPFGGLLLRDGASFGLSNRSRESMPLRAGEGWAAPPSPTAANTFSIPSKPPSWGCLPSTGAWRGARSVRQKSYASCTRSRVHSFQIQGSGSLPLALAATPASDFSL